MNNFVKERLGAKNGAGKCTQEPDLGARIVMEVFGLAPDDKNLKITRFPNDFIRTVSKDGTLIEFLYQPGPHTNGIIGGVRLNGSEQMQVTYSGCDKLPYQIGGRPIFRDYLGKRYLG